MRNRRPGHPLKNVRSGLATIAFLKARFDAGMDHLGMFQPFVEAAIRRYEKDDIDVAGVQAAVRDSTGLPLPTEIVKTLLGRAARKGLLTRSGGRYFREPHCDEDSELDARMEELGIAQQRLAARLRQFSASRGDELESDDAALAALGRFLDGNHIGVVLGQPVQTGSSVAVAQQDHAVAAFVADIVEEGGPDRAVLEDIVKGFIVQNALLLRDIPSVKRHLEGLTVFVDTGVLLRALGYCGHQEKQAATESLGLIRGAGARLHAFERTVNEVDSLLRVYENRLGSSAGIKGLRGTQMTFHFLNIKATPADVRQEAELVRQNLGRLGISVREFPAHINEHTEDEQALADALRDPKKSKSSDDSRIWHDVNAVAAVITLRGARPSHVPNARFVFASDSVRTVSTVTDWYRDSNPHGSQPIVHFRSVANAAWLLRPGDADDVPMHELISVCAAVLRPSPDVWAGFVRRLDEFVASGELSDDESIAVLAKGFTRRELADHELGADVEATTVREIVQRVREEDEARLRALLDESRRKAEESERAAAAARDEAVSIRNTLKAQVEKSANREVFERVREEDEARLRALLDEGQRKAEESECAAAAARDEAASIRNVLKAQVEKFAKWLAVVVYAGLCAVILFGAILTLPVEWSDSTQAKRVLHLVLWGFVAVFFAVSSAGLFIRRFHVLNIYDWLNAWFVSRLQSVLLPEADGDSVLSNSQMSLKEAEERKRE